MEFYHSVIFFCVALAVCNGFLFRPNAHASADGRAVEASCLELADAGSCDFYACFERRLPCGRSWYILKTGQYYCNKMQRRKPNFSAAGQRFIDDAQRCMTQFLKDTYRSDDVDCHSLEHRAIDSITPCFTDNGFCGILRHDSAELFNLFEFGDLFTRGAGKLWREIFSLAATCARETINEIASSAEEVVSNTVDSVVENLPPTLQK
ncbi:hypothetical protein Btru_066573 [Bulinus truncatus]|nr:hypothetical protein Btru_066573 [Bulinus truncatus]